MLATPQNVIDACVPRNNQTSPAATDRLLAVLRDATGPDGWCEMSQGALAARIGCSKTYVKRVLGELIEQDKLLLVSAAGKGRGGRNRYRLDDLDRKRQRVILAARELAAALEAYHV